MIEEKEIKIKLLEFPECVREKVGMYVGGAEDATVIFREIIDNSMDEAYSSSCDSIFIHQNFNGFHFVADNGRGLPITMSEDKPDQTQASLAVGSLHAGSKFDGSSSGDAKIGTNGVGSSCTNALSEKFVVLSRVTKDNYNRSIPIVKDVWDSFGPRSKGDIYYYLEYHKGYKVREIAGKLHDLEKFIFGDKYKYQLPEGYSTYVLFKPDPEIFDSVKSKVPVKNLEYFMLIQEKFYKKQVNVILNGEHITGNYPRYRYEVCKTITPADTSFNKKVGFYMTFEVDPNLGGRDTMASVNGLVTDQGHHVQIAEICYKDALVRNYNITHNYLLNGLKIIVVALCQECMFDSQTKVRLKSIVKVKSSDFEDVTKEIIKVFRSDPEYWDLHVQRLNAYAESMVSLSTMDRIKKDLMKSVTVGGVRGKAFLPDKLSDATAGMKERMKCELFLCLSGDTEVSVGHEAKPSYTDNCGFWHEAEYDDIPVTIEEIKRRFDEGESIELTSIDPDSGVNYTSWVTDCRITKYVDELTYITIEGDDVVKCTDNHRFLMIDGSYKMASELKVGDEFMPCYKYSHPNSPKRKKLNPGVKLIRIETKDVKSQPVYDLTVDGYDHNFLLNCGIYSHNCEGDSAAGSLKSGRKNTMYHAVMGLRGKTLNTINLNLEQVMDNKELNTIFQAIGLGVDSYNITSDANTKEEKWELIKKHARYGKVIISTDADPDGAAICASLLSTIGKFMKFLIDFGMVYVIEAPIYEQDGKFFFPSDMDKNGNIIGFDQSKKYTRFKGLGEMSRTQVHDAFYDTTKRRLIRVTPEGLEKAQELVRSLDERKKLLEENGILTNPYNLR